MKAVVLNAYGGPEVLELKEVDRPEVDENAVRVRVHAAGLNAGDYFSMRGTPWLVRLSVGFPKPKDHILGWDLAGEVDLTTCNRLSFPSVNGPDMPEGIASTNLHGVRRWCVQGCSSRIRARFSAWRAR